MSTSSVQIIWLSSWAEPSSASTMATSPWRGSLMSCSTSLRSLHHCQGHNSRSQTSGYSREEQKIQCDKVIHQKFRTHVGELLWMAQPRDDLKHPVMELSRSLINPQDQDIKDLAHLCKLVNHTRDFIFIMELQLPVRNQQGKFPFQSTIQTQTGQVVKTQGSQQRLIGFSTQCRPSVNQQNSGVNCSLISRERIVCSDSGSRRIIGNQEFIQEFSSAILLAEVSIVTQTDLSAGKSMASRLGTSCRQQLSYLISRSQHCHSNRSVSKEVNGIKTRHFMSSTY